MRSPAELAFRLKQEAMNAWLWLRPPDWSGGFKGPLAGLPDPGEAAKRLQGSAFACEVERLAEEILQHRFRLLGYPPLDVGPVIPWRRDCIHGKETGLEYFRQIPYLDFARAGDHKIIWELNRHQHLVLLSQAFLLTGRREFLTEIEAQIDSWMEANPFQRGINWASALEVGFRTLSWLWVLHFTGSEFPEDFRRRWMRALYHHGLHLEHNLSFYFSPNTHLLGEAVALHGLGRLCPSMPGAARWRELGRETVEAQMRNQVRDDGSHFEQSSYYHLYATDFFLLHLILTPLSPAWFRKKLEAMAEFLHALVSSCGILTLIGDEDGGRLFHPYGDRREFAKSTLATCAAVFNRPEWVRDPAAATEQAMWWIGRDLAPRATDPSSRWFSGAGIAVLRSAAAHIVVDAGPFGSGSAGHSHADTLAITAFRNGEELLIDPASYTYVGDAKAREMYRSGAAHNTISIEGLEQAQPQGPFRWLHPPDVEMLSWESSEAADILDARCRYGGFEHRRSVVFLKPACLIVLDRVSGPAGNHRVEQRWLVPKDVGGDFLAASPECVAEPAERSRAFGSREEGTRWVARYSGPLPATFASLIRFDGHAASIRTRTENGRTVIEVDQHEVEFPEQGAPRAKKS